MLLYWAFQAAAFVTRLVPLRVSYLLARGGGVLTYYAWAGGRRRCVQNMCHVTNGDVHAARRYARASFANYVVYLVDFFRFMRTDAATVTARVRFEDWEQVEALRTGKGIVMMTMHFGNWDIGAAILPLKGFPVSAIVDTFANERVNRLVMRSREHLGMKIIQADRAGPGILRALRDNNVLGVVMDVPRPGGLEVQFFGDTIAVSDGPARIALRAGASVVAGVMPRVSPWRDIMGAEVSAVAFQPTGDQDRDVHGLTQAVFSHFEQFIRRDPAQWYIFRNLWLSDMARVPAPAAISR